MTLQDRLNTKFQMMVLKLLILILNRSLFPHRFAEQDKQDFEVLRSAEKFLRDEFGAE